MKPLAAMLNAIFSEGILGLSYGDSHGIGVIIRASLEQLTAEKEHLVLNKCDMSTSVRRL